MFGSKIRWAMVVGALAIAAPMMAGCPKKEESKSEASKDDKKKDDKKSDDKKSADDDDDDKGDSKEYAAGDILKHVPKKCGLGRVYINFAGITDEPAIKKNIHKLDDKFAESMKGKDGDKAKDMLKILEKAGIEPAKDVKEIAICANDEKDVVVAVAGDFAGKDVLAAIVKMADKDGETLKKKEEGGVSYLKGKDKFMIGQLTPNVFAISADLDQLTKLAKSDDQSKEWDVAEGRLISIKGEAKPKGIDSLVAQLNEKGDALEIKVVAELSGKAAKELDKEEDPEATFKKVLEQAASKIEKGPLSSLADDVRNVKLKIDGHKLTVTMKMSNKDLGQALSALADASESDLENLGD